MGDNRVGSGGTKVAVPNAKISRVTVVTITVRDDHPVYVKSLQQIHARTSESKGCGESTASLITGTRLKEFAVRVLENLSSGSKGLEDALKWIDAVCPRVDQQGTSTDAMPGNVEVRLAFHDQKTAVLFLNPPALRLPELGKMRVEDMRWPEWLTDQDREEIIMIDDLANEKSTMSASAIDVTEEHTCKAPPARWTGASGRDEAEYGCEVPKLPVQESLPSTNEGDTAGRIGDNDGYDSPEKTKSATSCGESPGGELAKTMGGLCMETQGTALEPGGKDSLAGPSVGMRKETASTGGGEQGFQITPSGGDVDVNTTMGQLDIILRDSQGREGENMSGSQGPTWETGGGNLTMDTIMAQAIADASQSVEGAWRTAHQAIVGDKGLDKLILGIVRAAGLGCIGADQDQAIKTALNSASCVSTNGSLRAVAAETESRLDRIHATLSDARAAPFTSVIAGKCRDLCVENLEHELAEIAGYIQTSMKNGAKPLDSAWVESTRIRVSSESIQQALRQAERGICDGAFSGWWPEYIMRSVPLLGNPELEGKMLQIGKLVQELLAASAEHPLGKGSYLFAGELVQAWCNKSQVGLQEYTSSASIGGTMDTTEARIVGTTLVSTFQSACVKVMVDSGLKLRERRDAQLTATADVDCDPRMSAEGEGSSPFRGPKVSKGPSRDGHSVRHSSSTVTKRRLEAESSGAPIEHAVERSPPQPSASASLTETDNVPKPQPSEKVPSPTVTGKETSLHQSDEQHGEKDSDHVGDDGSSPAKRMKSGSSSHKGTSRPCSIEREHASGGSEARPTGNREDEPQKVTKPSSRSDREIAGSATNVKNYRLRSRSTTPGADGVEAQRPDGRQKAPNKSQNHYLSGECQAPNLFNAFASEPAVDGSGNGQRPSPSGEEKGDH
jgi:hypothetical protein